MPTVDSGIDQRPDLYFVVEHNGRVIFESPTINNLSLETSHNTEFSFERGIDINLGTFFID